MNEQIPGNLYNKENLDFPSDRVVKNPPASAGEMGSIPCPGR